MRTNEVVFQYFEHGAYVGSERREYRWRPGGYLTEQRYWPQTAYFCAECGEIWLRCIAQTDGYRPPGWAIRHVRCAEHGEGFLLSWADLEGADYELLTRELLATLKES